MEKESKRDNRDLLSCVTTPFAKGIKSIYYVRTFTDDGGEVGANHTQRGKAVSSNKRF